MLTAVAAVVRLMQSTAGPPSPTPGSGSDSSAPFIERFLTSSGFGGLMAVVAASIAATIAYLQFSHNRKKAADDRWWDTLTWVYDRSAVSASDRPPLPQRVTFSMLTALSDEATSDKHARLRGETISAILTMFEGSDRSDSSIDVEHPESTGSADQRRGLIPVADPDAAALLDFLRDDLARQGLASPHVRLVQARRYEDEVRGALTRIVASSPDASLVVEPGHADVGYDFAVRADGVVILVAVKYSRKTIIPSLAADWAHRLRRSGPFPKGDAPGGAVIVANSAMTRNAAAKLAEMYEGKIVHVVWRSEDDDTALLGALVSLGLPDHQTGDTGRGFSA